MKQTGPSKAVRMRVAREEGLIYPEPFFWTTASMEQLQRRDPDYRKHLRARALDALKSSPDKIRLAAEGDSWFDHPCVREVMHWVKDAGYAVYRSDAPGRRLAKMLEEKVYLRFLDDPSVRAMLLSGGGNDLINWKRASPGASPIFKPGNGSGKAADYLDFSELDAALATISGLLAQFSSDVRKKRPNLPIITHCYDWFEPRTSETEDTWIGPQMDVVGIPKPLRKEVAALLINHANDTYRRVCSSSRMTYVDLRGATRGRWHDEIHPNADAFSDIAAKLIAAMPAGKARSKARSPSHSPRRRGRKGRAR
jgi:hypothetical protein